MPSSSATRSGIKNYARYLNVLAGTDPYVYRDIGSYDLLQSEVLTSSAASVTFSGLSAYASTYQHLQIRYVARSTRAATTDTAFVRINGDTGSNYALHQIYGTGSIVDYAAASSTNLISLRDIAGATATASAFNVGVLDLLDPFSSNKNTTIRVLAGGTTSNFIGLLSGLWVNTNAVSSLTLDLSNGDYATGSRFSLFGVKKAA